MPLSTNLDVSPYFDDYYTEAQGNGYVKILFKPTQAVQARELTQMQSMLQDQIERLGNWSFESGDIVYGCAINDLPVVPYVYLQDFQANGGQFSVANVVGTVAISGANLQAQVLLATPGVVANYPNTSIIYLQYLNAGANGVTQFSNTDSLTFISTSNSGNTTVAIVNVYSNTGANTIYGGNAHAVSISDGVIYMHGYFVAITQPIIGIVNAYGTDAANNVVGLKLIENIVSASQDINLFDGAQGFSNFNAPGADRLQLIPELISYDANTALSTPGFVPLVTYSDGALAITASDLNPQGTLGAAIAERIYDEAGNYVVNPFPLDVITSSNGDVIIPDANTVLVRVGAGTGYAGGYRVQIQKTAYVNVNKALSTQTVTLTTSVINTSSYLLVNELAGFFDFTTAAPVYFYDSHQAAITAYTFANTTPSGNLIGQALAKQLTLYQGTPGTNTAQYSLAIFNATMNQGYIVEQIKSVFANTGPFNAVADIAVPGLFGLTTTPPTITTFGYTAVQTFTDEYNNNNTCYRYRNQFPCTMFSNGVIVRTITSSVTGGIDTIPYPVGFLTQAQASELDVICGQDADSAALTGTVTVSTTTTTVVTGISTIFRTHYRVGERIKIGTVVRTIVTIASDTSLTVDLAFGVTFTSVAHYKHYPKGCYLPLLTTVVTGPVSYVQCVNTTSMTIGTGQFPSVSINCIVVHNILRSQVVPCAKEIRKNRLVKIDCRANPRGPWCLGFPDVHQVTKVWATSNGTYTTSGLEVTDYFNFDTGQQDTNYGLGYLHCAGFDATSAPFLLVMCDYFVANTTAGSGVFHIGSYPIDDENDLNPICINTKHIPCHIDRCGNKHQLRDCFDFRPHCYPTVPDCGFCDLTNPVSIASCISTTTVCTNVTVTLVVPGTSLLVPTTAATVNTSVTYYVPRKDIVYITPDNQLNILEGVGQTNSTPPVIPDDGLSLGVISIAQYPSLASDDLDELAAINQTSINTVRDTSLAITIAAIQQRRYTMRDIGKLDLRLTNLEKIVALSIAEQAARDMSIIDMITGLEKPKTGIFVEQFIDIDTCCVSDPEFCIGIDRGTQTCRPRILSETINCVFNQAYSNSVQVTGSLVTLPYTHSVHLDQPRFTCWRAPPLCSFGWMGLLSLFPCFEPDVDRINVGSVCITNTADGSIGVQDFHRSPYSTYWGLWRTVSNTHVTNPPPCPPSTPSPYVTAAPNTHHFYQAWCQYDLTPPPYYCQGHLSFICPGVPASPPIQIDTTTIKVVADFGTEGDGVIEITSFPSL